MHTPCFTPLLALELHGCLLLYQRPWKCLILPLGPLCVALKQSLAVFSATEPLGTLFYCSLQWPSPSIQDVGP